MFPDGKHTPPLTTSSRLDDTTQKGPSMNTETLDTPRRALTLIELLVVVTVIVLLPALLAPALDSAMEAAQRAKCAANLHAFGIAIPQYAMDNKRKMLLSVRLGNDGKGGGPKEGYNG